MAEPCKRGWFGEKHVWKVVETVTDWDLVSQPASDAVDGLPPRPPLPPPREGMVRYLQKRVCTKCGAVDDEIKRFLESHRPVVLEDNITPPECEFGKIALLAIVPLSERQRAADDIAEAYAIEVASDIPGGCIIWGLYHGRWMANVSGRWIISYLIQELNQAKAKQLGAGRRPWPVTG